MSAGLGSSPKLAHLWLSLSGVLCLTLASCEGASSFCSSDPQCASTCASFGHPVSGARCNEGRCTCALPADQDELELGDQADLPDELGDQADLPDELGDQADLPDEHSAPDELVEESDTPESDTVDEELDEEQGDDEVPSPRCAIDSIDLGSFCMDRFEAPNREGELPFVMFSFYEAERWCQARGKRLCFDDEWTLACAGPEGWSYPYHASEHRPGVCNDEELWRAYNQDKLNGWPWNLGVESLQSVDELLDLVRQMGSAAVTAAEHVWDLYQGEGAGSNAGCTRGNGTFDLLGNVEEWTRRRDGGEGPDFSGALKGRYWSESRTCQSAVKTHGNAFRFYEIGFRCCADPREP